MAEKLNRTDAETIQFGRYNISNASGYEINACFMQNITGGDSVWQIQNPLANYLPGLAMQVGLMIFISRIFMFILKPLRQHRFIAEVFAGILIGPTCLSKLSWVGQIFTFESNMLLETFASFGLTYYMFLVGLEMDLTVVRNMSKNTRVMVIGSILIPMGFGAALYFIPMRVNKDRTSLPLGSIFWAISISITSFPDLARILSDVKLLHTDIGRMALTTSIFSDIIAWVLLVAAITIFDQHKFLAAAVPTVVFIIVCWFLIRPGIGWMIKETKKKGGKFSDIHINFILTGVAACGFITDACGSHSMIGGFMLGLIIPNGELAMMIMESIGEFVSGIMLPVFIMVNGIRTNLSEIPYYAHWESVVLIAVGATSAKILSALLVSMYIGITAQEGLALGGLMNTKGVLALIVLNEGRNLKLIDNVTMTVMMVAILFMTAMVGPIFFLSNKTAKKAKQYKQRTILRSNPNTQLRILVCIHSVRNLSGIVSILEFSNATRKSPMCVFVTHLVELLGRASAMLIVHEKGGKTNAGNNPPSREKAESDQIIGSFQSFEARNDAVSMYPLTVVSPYTTMHEDIVSIAEDKRVAMILIPFHKQMTAGGGLQGENHSIREVNQNLLLKAPCSVGILIDRGLGSFMTSTPSSNINNGGLELRFAMLFIGGPDDHEALSYAYRMARTPGISLTVVRFLPGKDAQLNLMPEDEDNEDGILEAITDIENDKEHDDEFINEFRFKAMNDQSVLYHEKIVNNGAELVESIRTKYTDFDLYLVGRGLGVKTPLTMGLLEWSENPELGAIGETLVSSEFTAHASVLVVQQPPTDGFRSNTHRGKFGQKKWTSPILNPDFENFENRKKKNYVD
ncbi:hypothetical protein Ddye_025175 [Dipteronia dyeriana]|uniref:Cation/H+ exchanger domain-containing protein n=1 Tax=Dipteronia dyeriana TaxID=168575 RepID=A0AAD9WUY3_9ROSI|nr:hypothetical protein Ddye_025175 [Dipteronia dyeriana]